MHSSMEKAGYKFIIKLLKESEKSTEQVQPSVALKAFLILAAKTGRLERKRRLFKDGSYSIAKNTSSLSFSSEVCREVDTLVDILTLMPNNAFPRRNAEKI